MSKAIEPKQEGSGIAVKISVSSGFNRMLESEDGSASLSYLLQDDNDNILTSGTIPVDGTFCSTWDGNYDQAYDYVAEQLNVTIIN